MNWILIVKTAIVVPVCLILIAAVIDAVGKK